MAERGKIFEYAVIYHPAKEKDKPQEPSKIVVDVTRVIAADERAVGLMAARAIPEDYAGNLDKCEVAIRPF